MCIDYTTGCKTIDEIWDFNEWHYRGKFVDDVPTENGKLYYYNDIYYQGTYENELPNGYGILYYTDYEPYSTFEGWFENGIPTNGTIYLSNGDVYSGDVIKYEMDGYGIYTSADGTEKYEGFFENGMITEGIFEFPGGYYSGMFPGNGIYSRNGIAMNGKAERTESGWSMSPR